MSSSKNLDFEKTSFLNKSNSAFIEEMYLKFVNKDADLPESWANYFEGIGEELNVIAKEINGPSWGPTKKKVNLDELQKKIQNQDKSYVENTKSGLDLYDTLFEKGKDLDVKPGCPNLIERIESALLSYGNDIDINDNPLECGFDKFVNVDSDINFLGKEKLIGD